MIMYIYTNKKRLEAINNFLSLTYCLNNKFYWKERNVIGISNSSKVKAFNTRLANKEVKMHADGIIKLPLALDVVFSVSIDTILHVYKFGKLPLGRACSSNLNIYPDNEFGLCVYKQFLGLISYSENDKCFYWNKRLDTCNNRKFNGKFAGKKVGKTVCKNMSGFYAGFTISGKTYQISLLHALWLLKKGVPSELPLYFTDIKKGLCIDNLTND